MELTGFQVWSYGTIASLIAGAATSLGALPIFFMKKTLTEKQLDMALGFAAGVMLAATMFSLIVPAIEFGGITITVIGIIIGAIILELMDTYAPHEHFLKGHEGPNLAVVKKVWLFVIAITLHNFPEGMAVGVSFGGGTTEMIKNGIVVATAIGIQNIPEGTATAVSFIKAGYTKKQAFWYSAFSGFVEPIGGIIGATFIVLMKPALPFFLALAAGAMLYVISDEIIPETHAHNNERAATFSLIFGFLVMMILDNALG
ncbi:protein gufA [Marinitoga sp. 1135]|uniref:Putative divalent heavy-metal cations transporter n=2 Tax=Marinitoga TaxID=160798 RepID=H2J845_MARPK|nr:MULTISPECIES: ZIP family metal transporter [Marinitoga]AEX85536.1 putative divalent heavy-metal cations transporter [Marinitoga piezophila KA3]APT76009.1 protein gufA [Marinitoga sp. 1137]NUU95752.1 protein gufA [Marinitoga sp. 1135]NUU97674.1 protein gufA [Marinitoga sp. 1138]